MTKIVVVGEGFKEIFEGDIEARTNEGINLGSISEMPQPVLFIYDTKIDAQIAAFIKYDYWRETE